MGSPANVARVNTGVARVLTATAPDAILLLQHGLWVGSTGAAGSASDAEVVSEIGLDVGAQTRVGWANARSSPTGSLTIESGGLVTAGLVIGQASDAVEAMAVTGTVDVPDGVTSTGINSTVNVGIADTTSASSPVADGTLTIRTGDLITTRLIAGTAQASGNGDVNVTASSSAVVQVLDGHVGSDAAPLTGLEIGTIWLSGRRGSTSGGSVEVAGDLYFNNTGGSIVLATSSMWADPNNSALQPRAASGSLQVGGTAHIRANGLSIGSGVGVDSTFTGSVDIAHADVAVNVTNIGVASSLSRDHTVHGELYLRNGIASLGATKLAVATGATDTTATGLLALGSVTTATTLALGDGAELRFLLRDGGESGNLTLTGAAVTTLDGELMLDVLAGESLGVGDVITLLQTSAGFAAGSSFDNVVSGGILSSLDGDHMFAVHYGSGSLYDDNAVVAVVTNVVPEPTAVGLLLILGGAAFFGRPR